MKRITVSVFFLVFIPIQIFSQMPFDIQGHRGCRGLYPENTVVAFIEAVKLGVNTLEMDVVVSKDGKLVVSHDPVMNDEICSTPDGNAIAATEKNNYRIYNLTYEEIKKFDRRKSLYTFCGWGIAVSIVALVGFYVYERIFGYDLWYYSSFFLETTSL